MSKKSQFGMTLLLSTIIVGGANASTVSTSNTLGATMIAQQGAVCKGVVKDATGEPIIGASVSVTVPRMLPLPIWTAILPFLV